MKLKFRHDYSFYAGMSTEPIITFNKGEVINLLSPTEDDPHSYTGKNHIAGGVVYTQPENVKNWWVEAKNGVTIWTSIPVLLLQNVLEPLLDEKGGG